AVDFGELRGKTAAGGVAAVEDTLGAQLADGHFGDAGDGVAATQVDADVRVGPHGADALFPVAAGVAADEFCGGMAFGECGQVHGCGFAGKVAGDFYPGVLKDDGFQFGGSFDDRVELRRVSVHRNPELD